MSVLLGQHSNLLGPFVSTEIAYRTWVHDDRGSPIGQGCLDGVVRGEVGLILWDPAWWSRLRSLSCRGITTTVGSALTFRAVVAVRRHAVWGDERPCCDNFAAPAAVGTADRRTALLLIRMARVLSPHVVPAASMKHVTARKSAHELMVLEARHADGALVVISFVPNDVVGSEACLVA